jgi:hypothetical protein
MGFFDSLRRVLGGNPRDAADPGLVAAWKLGDTDENVTPAAEPEPFHGGEYDKKNWRKKLKLILDDLPASQPRWADHIAEAHALGFDAGLIRAWCRDEFSLLVRRVVADRVVTESEHRKLDLARDLLGIPEAEAEEILHAVVADAEQFFGGTVEGA